MIIDAITAYTLPAGLLAQVPHDFYQPVAKHNYFVFTHPGPVFFYEIYYPLCFMLLLI
jgi:hypothetical protein